MRHLPQSPYTRAIGERKAQLHPVLREYFSPIPEGLIGVGEGVFEVVGMRKRWLRPLLRPLQRRGVLYAGWEEDVPFRIVNRTVAGRAIAEREFRLPQGVWTMRDATALSLHGRLVDEVGEPVTAAVSFDTEVEDGALKLTSRAVGLRLGRLRLRVPRLLSPVMRLIERFDEPSQQQRVDVTIDMPVIGRIYEYRGRFDYRIEPETP